MSDRSFGSTVSDEALAEQRRGASLTKDFDAADSISSDFDVADFDVETAARQFDSQLRERGDGSPTGALDHSRIVWVLRLLHATLRAESSVQSDSPAEGSCPGSQGRLELPEKIGRFEIGRLLGFGGFGEVYRAYDEVLHRDVALKVIPRRAGMPIDEGDYRLNEARAAARLNHPNLVPLYEVLEAEDYVCLVSEFCNGPTLRRYLTELSEPLKPAWAAEIVLKLSTAIAHAHSRGLVHRDIKPGNVILVPETVEDALLPFSPRLTDFGLVLDTQQPLAIPQPARLVGTILYMPPEVLMGEVVTDARSGDVYSLGLMLYEMLRGELPFRAKTASGMLQKICLEELPPFENRKYVINRDLQAICFRAMAKQPAQRYESVDALVDDLNRYRKGQSVSARPRSWTERSWRAVRKHPFVWSLLAMVIALTIGGTLALGRQNLRLQQQSTAIEKTLSRLSISERQAVQSRRDAIVARDHAAAERDRAEANQQRAVGIAYRSDLLEAFTALGQSNVASAMSCLEDIESYIGDGQRERFDLHVLRTLAHDGWSSLARYDCGVEEIVLFPNQKWFAIAAADNRVRIYRVDDATLVHEIELFHGARIHALAVSADESQIAIGASQPEWLSFLGLAGDTVSLFSLDVTSFAPAGAVTRQLDRDVRTRLTGFAATVDSLAFAPDGKRLAIGARYEPIEVRWLGESADESVGTQRYPSTRRNEDLFFATDGTLVWLSGEKDFARQSPDAIAATVRVGAAPDSFNRREFFKRFACSADGEWVVTAISEASEAWLFRGNGQGQTPTVLENEHGELNGLCVSPSSEFVAAGTTDGAVVVWRLPKDVAPGSRVATIRHQVLHHSSVAAISIDDAGRIISGSSDGSVVFSWLHAQDSAVKTYRLASQSNAADMSADAEMAVVGCQDGSIWRLNLDSGEQTCLRASEDNSFIMKVSISRSSPQFAVGDLKGRAWIGSLATTNELTKLPMPDTRNATEVAVNAISMSDCSPRLVILRGASLLQWIDTGTFQTISEFHAPTGIEAIGMLDCDTAVTFGDRIYTSKANELTLPMLPRDGTEELACVCFDPTRGSFVAGGRDGIVRAMTVHGDVLKTSRRWQSSQPDSQIACFISVIAISPDGENLVTGSRSGDCAIWDAETLQLVGTISSSHDGGEIEQVRFSADGRTLMIHQRHSAVLTRQTRGEIRLIQIDAD